MKIHIYIFFSLIICFVGCKSKVAPDQKAESDEAVSEESIPRYIRNVDYHLPRNGETFLYATFMINHSEWPHVTWVGVSRYGYVFVLQHIEETKYKLTPLLVPPHEIEQLCNHIEMYLQGIKSRPNRKHEPYLISSTIAYSQPSLSHVGYATYSDVKDEVAPLYNWILDQKRRAVTIWENTPEKGKGPHTIGVIDTQDREFLPHMMNTLHNVSTWRINEMHNQQVEPIVTTPVDEVEAQSTQAHP
jgi:hypothetical protein